MLSPKSYRPQGVGRRHHESLSLQAQLSEATLQNSRHLALLSKVYHLATVNAEHSFTLQTVKDLINKSGLLDFDSLYNGATQTHPSSHGSHLHISPLQSLGSANKNGTLSPPITDPDPDSHSDIVDISDVELTDGCLKTGSSGSHCTSTSDTSNSSSSSSSSSSSNKNNNSSRSINREYIINRNNSNNSINSSTPPLEMHKMTTTNAVMSAAPPAPEPETMNTAPASHQQRQQPPAQIQVDANESNVQGPVAEEVEAEDNEEFTLEEELEGIADAPVEERAAMRKALREKQFALQRQMRESAADKRRIAEKEAYLIKQTLLRDGMSLTPSSKHSPKHSPKHSSTLSSHPSPDPNPDPSSDSSSDPSASHHAQSSKSSLVLDNAPAVQPSPSKPKRAASYDHGYSSSKEASNAAKGSVTATASSAAESAHKADTDSHKAETLVPVDDSDDDDKSQSSAIINFETETPKNSSRFGIAFDPSTLDKVTTDRISGVCGDKDTRRAVLVQNIPPESTLHEFMAYIRGGSVLAVKLVSDPTDGGNTQTAMITFKTSREARACLELCACALPQSGLASKLRFSLLPTASYPSADVIPSCDPGCAGFFFAEEPTRCLTVDNFPKYLINELCTELYLNASQHHNKAHVLEEMWFSQDTLHIHFTSIQEAKKAHGIISVLHYGKYRTDVHYSPDPCAGTHFDVSSSGTVTPTSNGCQGLKSLLETTGLVGYAKLYMHKMKGAPATAAAPRSAPRSVAQSVFSAAPAAAPMNPIVQPAVRPASASSSAHITLRQSQVPWPKMASFSNSTASLLMSIDPGMCDAAGPGRVDPQGDVAQPVDGCVKPAPPMGSSPWTDTLMAGLDML